MKKVFLSILLTILPMLVNGYTGNVEINGINYYIVTKGKTAEVCGIAYNNYSLEIVIPETIEYDGVVCKVVSIANSAFRGNAFIKSVLIPKSVKTIGECAFYDCSALEVINLPEELTSVSEFCFQNCKGLTTIVLPPNLTEIGRQAFLGCSNLKTLSIPRISNNITIGASAFWECGGLSSVNISDLESWFKLVFYDKTSNPLYYAQHLYLNDKEIIDLVVPSGITNVKAYAFYGYKVIKSVIFPNSLLEINGSAFNGCTALETITFGSNTTNLYASAFENCKELTDVYCYAEKVPGYYKDCFSGSFVEYATLHVLDNLVENYKSTTGWKDFGTIIGIDSEPLPKCSKPEIYFNDGVISFSCETEGVSYVSELSLADNSTNNLDNINLASKYKVSVYATKNGYRNSDITTVEIIARYGQAVMLGDVDGDGKVNVADHVKLSEIIMGQNK
jgi:hypothetical protein